MHQQSNTPLKALLQFNDPVLLKRAMTFKSYQQEYNGRNKDNPLTQGNNETLIDFGQEIFNFLYVEFLVYQGLPKSDGAYFKTFGEIQSSKPTITNDVELAKISNSLNLNFSLSTNPQSHQKLLENPKFHAQAIKALIGAQYLDKQKDLNKLRKLLAPLYDELLKGFKFAKQEPQINHKGLFYEYIQQMKKKYEINVKLLQDENEHLFENKQIYKMTLILNDLIPIEREGVQKKDVERQLYKDALRVMKDPGCQKLLEDRFVKKGIESTFASYANQSFDAQEESFILDQPGPSSILQSQIHSSVVSQPAQGVIGDLGDQLKIKSLVSNVLGQYDD